MALPSALGNLKKNITSKAHAAEKSLQASRIGHMGHDLANKAKATANTAVKQLPGKPGTPGHAAAKPVASAATPPPSARKGFDISLYVRAVGMFFNDFSKNKLPYFFKNIGPVMQNAPNWWNKLPQDEQAAYGVMGFGGFLFLVGIVLLIVL